MCGIVAIVSRPAQRPAPTAEELLRLLDTAVASPVLVDAAASVAEVDRLLHGVPGTQALVDRSELITGITARLDQIDARIAERDAELEAAVETAARGARGRERRTAGAPRRRLGGAQRPHPHRAVRRRASPGATPASPPSPATSRCSRRSRRSTGWRSAAATAPASTCSCGITVSTPPIRRCSALLARRTRDPLFQSGSVRLAGRVPQLRLQGRGRDRRARRQREGAARRVHADELLRLALLSPSARVVGARPHPLGQRRHHQRAQLPPGERRADRAARWRGAARTRWPC